MKYIYHLLLVLVFVCVPALCHAQKDTVRVTIFGDSYSTFEGYIPGTNEPWYAPEGSQFSKGDSNDVKLPQQTWWWLVCEKMGYYLEMNNSWSGSTVGYYGYQNENYQPRSFNTRVAYLGNPDIILCLPGTNDSWTGEKVGEYKWANWTENDMWYFRPSFARLLCTMRQSYPLAKVYIIINTELKEEHTESMKVICRHFGVPYIMLHDIDKQSGHPSQKGMRAIADQVVSFIQSN